LGQKYLKADIAISGTSILILVAVALETLRAIESRALMLTYDQYTSPEYFYGEPALPHEAAYGARRLKFLPFRRKPGEPAEPTADDSEK
jgi:hypothetical protein